MKRRIMVVDDEEALIDALRRLFRRMPCTYGILAYELELEMFTSPKAALARAREMEFAAFLSDYRMPEMDGVKLLRQVKEIQPNAVQILFSGNADRDVVEQAFKEMRISRFVAKPWDDALLLSAIAESLTYRDIMLEKIQHSAD